MFPSSARCAQLRRKAESRFYCIELFATTEYRGIAQLVEQRSPKPRVQSSSLCAPAKQTGILGCLFVLIEIRDTKGSRRFDARRIFVRRDRADLKA